MCLKGNISMVAMLVVLAVSIIIGHLSPVPCLCVPCLCAYAFSDMFAVSLWQEGIQLVLVTISLVALIPFQLVSQRMTSSAFLNWMVTLL